MSSSRPEAYASTAPEYLPSPSMAAARAKWERAVSRLEAGRKAGAAAGAGAGAGGGACDCGGSEGRGGCDLGPGPLGLVGRRMAVEGGSGSLSRNAITSSG